jgi:hypothetical protein
MCRLDPLAWFDLAAASLGNGCGGIRWAVPSRRGAVCVRWRRALNGEEFFMPF